MANKDIINLGITPDSGTGDSARLGGAKINTLFADIYSRFGDLAIDNNPNSPTYGQRPALREYQYQVGELHPAGRYRRIAFYNDSDGAWAGGVRYNLFRGGILGWDDTFPLVNVEGLQIPALYLKKNWYFMSRGEAINADLTYTDSDVHIVLPLARVGDVCRIRDVNGTWGPSRGVNIWTSPYQFIPSALGPGIIPDTAANFFENTPGFTTSGGASPIQSIAFATSVYTTSTPLPEDNRSYKNYSFFTGDASFLNYEYGGLSNGDSRTTFRQAYSEVELIFLGPQYGWVPRVTFLSPSAAGSSTLGYTAVNIASSNWVQISNTDVVGVPGDDEEVIVPADWYVYPLSAPAIPVATRLSLDVYRQTGDHVAVNTPFWRQMIAIGNNPNTPQSFRTWVANQAFATTDAFYKKVDITVISDSNSNVLLVSEVPFDGQLRITYQIT